MELRHFVGTLLYVPLLSLMGFERRTEKVLRFLPINM